MFTPATRQEMQPSARSACTGYLVKPLRAASLAARLTAENPDVMAPGIAGDAIADDAPIETPAAPSRAGMSILVAEDNEIKRAVDALAARPARAPCGHHHQRRRGAGIMAYRPTPPAARTTWC